VRVVCNNTLQQALGDSTGRVTLPHLREFDADAIKDQLGIGRTQWEAFTQTLDTLARIEVNSREAVNVIGNVFKIPDGPDKQKSEDVGHANNIVDLFTRQAYVGADLAGNTAWGLLNCVTEYYDWHKRARGQDTRLNNAWFGEGAKIKQRAANELLKLAA
jgi:phage/plasmid-like protein (TIGR03299 family)